MNKYVIIHENSPSLTDSITPISKEGWAWESSIDEKDLSLNTIEGRCCVD
jgi:hypothetical protein